MKLPRRLAIFTLALAACSAPSGCRGFITNDRSRGTPPFANPRGIPWVETRLYDVYVYEGTPDADEEGMLIYCGRHALVDKVNGTLVDPHRPRWETNYLAGPFCDASVVLKFHKNGSLREVKLSAAPAPEGAAGAARAGLRLTGKIEEQELEQLRREQKLLELRRELEGKD